MAIQVEREAERGVSREASLAYVKKIEGWALTDAVGQH